MEIQVITTGVYVKDGLAFSLGEPGAVIHNSSADLDRVDFVVSGAPTSPGKTFQVGNALMKDMPEQVDHPELSTNEMAEIVQKMCDESMRGLIRKLQEPVTSCFPVPKWMLGENCK